MTRPTFIEVNSTALLHNLYVVKKLAPRRKIIAMVKANAYGCGVSEVAPVLAQGIDAFGVACLEEALSIRHLGLTEDCVLFHGVFQASEYQQAVSANFQCVLHHAEQLKWLLQESLDKPLKVWVKVNTGMNRLGFPPSEVYSVLDSLKSCPWVHSEIGLMTHFSSADELDNASNLRQMDIYRNLSLPNIPLVHSLANSAAIFAWPDSHRDAVRPGIMLYGVSPFSDATGVDKGLMPVMRFMSALTVVHDYPSGVSVGYGGIWQTKKNSRIGVVAAGYGDGYPRHVSPGTPVFVNGRFVPIVGRVSMDMLTVDLSDCPEAHAGDTVELWGLHVPVEVVAKSAGTIAYELLCQFSPRQSG